MTRVLVGAGMVSLVVMMVGTHQILSGHTPFRFTSAQFTLPHFLR